MPNKQTQLCRITENYSRAGLEARIREDIDAVNEADALYE